VIAPSCGHKHAGDRKGRIRPAVLIVFGLFAVMGIAAVLALAVLPGPLPAESPFPAAYSLRLDPGIQLAQTYNNCGPYSARAVIAVLTGRVPDAERLAAETGWRVYRNLTLPQGVIGLLNANGIRTRPFSLSMLDERKKGESLKRIVSRGHPVILLVQVGKVQHYLTVLGYDGNRFFLYDSFRKRLPDSRLTIDDNGWEPGNRTCPLEELLSLWARGGKLMFYRYYGIECFSDD
jgi:hypothetical protein